MGLKGAVRSMAAAARRAERERQRREREQLRLAKVEQKRLELEEAVEEVESYEFYVEALVSLHRGLREPIDWAAIASDEAPEEPTRRDVREQEALRAVHAYRPGLLDKLLKRTESRLATLGQAVQVAVREDDEEFAERKKNYELALEAWKGRVEEANAILQRSPDPWQELLDDFDPFEDAPPEIGADAEFKVETVDWVEATVFVQSDDIVPSEVRSLLQSGRMSIKQMPKGKFYALYQAHVASCVFRVAAGVFIVLPVSAALVTAKASLLNPATGHIEEQSILSVYVPRETLEGLNLDAIDPVEALRNFVHEMDFKKTKGFSAAKELRAEDFAGNAS